MCVCVRVRCVRVCGCWLVGVAVWLVGVVLCVGVTVAVAVAVVCSVWCGSLNNLRVYIQNVPVCTGTTPAIVTTCARGTGTHRDVLNVHTESVLNVHTETWSMHTPLPLPPLPSIPVMRSACPELLWTRASSTHLPHFHRFRVCVLSGSPVLQSAAPTSFELQSRCVTLSWPKSC